MSLVAIRNGTASLFSACGPWIQSEISTCDFGLLESVSSCALIFFPGRDTRIEPLRLGGVPARVYVRRWRIAGGLYIRDTGDTPALLSKVWQGHDDLYNTVSKDDSLQSSACAANLARLNFDPNVGVQAGGHWWALVEWEIEAEEF